MDLEMDEGPVLLNTKKEESEKKEREKQANAGPKIRKFNPRNR